MARIGDCVASRRRVAVGLASRLRDVHGVSAVVLFGSTSRGDAGEYSDIDLLVLAPTGADAGSIRRVCRDARPMKVSLVLHDTQSFEELKHEDWLFVRHLANEGTTLWDSEGDLRERLRVSYPGEATVIGEIEAEMRRVNRLRDLERYGNDFLFPLATVYGTAKRIAMLANARAGISLFQRQQALRACAELYPPAASDLQRIEALAGFYELTRGNRSVVPAFSSDGAASVLLESVTSLERLIEMVSVA